MLENAGNNANRTLTLSGGTAATTTSVSGVQGASGVSVEFLIQSTDYDIPSATFSRSGGTIAGAAYGIDNFSAEIPVPATLALLGLGLAGLGFRGRR